MKTTKKLLILIILSFCQFGHSKTYDTHNQLSSTVHQGCFYGEAIQIDLDKSQLNTLVEGQVSFSQNDDLQGIDLNFYSQDQSRTIFNNKVSEQTFLLWHNHDNDKLVLTTSPHSKACYTLSLHHNKTTIDHKDHHNDTPISPTLQQLHSKPSQEALSDFWQSMSKHGTPLIEQVEDKTLMTFLWREHEPTYNVRLLGSPSNDHEWLYKLPNSDVWYKSFWVKNGLILSYNFAPNVPTPIPDPNLSSDENSHRARRAMLAKIVPDPLNSQHFNQGSWTGINVAPPTFHNHQGMLTRHIFNSTLLNNQRRIWIYQTTNNHSQEPIVLYLLDGDEYLHRVGVPSLLDEFSQNTGLDVVAVFIDNVDRRHELPMNEEFIKMINNELVPFVTHTTNIPLNPNNTVVSGSSYGGLAAAFLAYHYPDTFGNVLPLSGSFWYKNSQDEHLYDLINKGSVSPTQKWHIMAGSYETHRLGETPNNGILGSSQTLKNTLNQQGNQATFRVYEGGHDYAVWRVALIDGLHELFAKP